MILFLYGKDNFRSRQQLNKMVAKFQIDRDPSKLNVIIPDITAEDPQRIIEEIHSAPFLSEKRMVVLKGLLASKEKKLQEMILAELKQNSVPASTILLFWEEAEEFKSTNLVKELFALLKEEKYAQRFDILVGSKLNECIEEQVHEHGGTIERPAVVYLAQNSKNDLWFVHSTLEQLVALCEGRTITLEDVKLFVPERFDDNIFNLVDAIVAGQSERVFQMLEEQYKKGEDAMFVFSMLIRQFRILLLIRDLLDRSGGRIPEGVAKDMGIHPFVLKKSTPYAQRYTTEDVKRIYSSLLDLDRKTKMGGGDQRVLLDIFIAKLCAKTF